MGLLLDTHVFVWAASAPERLTNAARSAIEDPSNAVFVSAAVAWEIAIKHGLGKLALPSDPPTYFPARITALGFRSLAIAQEHALAVRSLPNHHRDPFDRIMIAQAIVEGLTFVTADEAATRYSVRVLVT
ncbi:MAG: type II toxin-antitoxin system VapC family toxin [Candidatus Baltobacteraceae bacterium]